MNQVSKATDMQRLPVVMNKVGRSRSGLYQLIKQGLFTQPVRISTKCVAWPEYEIDAINAARIAGKTDDELRALVNELMEARKAVA